MKTTFKPRWRCATKIVRFGNDERLGKGNIIAYGMNGRKRGLSKPYLWENAVAYVTEEDGFSRGGGVVSDGSYYDPFVSKVDYIDEPLTSRIPLTNPTITEPISSHIVAIEVIPELFMPGNNNTDEENQQIADQIIQESIAIIQEAHPELSASYLISTNDIVQLKQMANAVEEQPSASLTEIKQAIAENTQQIIEATANEEAVPETLFAAPITEKALVKTKEVLTDISKKLGLISDDTPVKDKERTIYVVGAIAVVGVLALIFKS